MTSDSAVIDVNVGAGLTMPCHFERLSMVGGVPDYCSASLEFGSISDIFVGPISISDQQPLW